MARWLPEGTPTAARALCWTWGEEGRRADKEGRGADKEGRGADKEGRAWEDTQEKGSFLQKVVHKWKTPYFLFPAYFGRLWGNYWL